MVRPTSRGVPAVARLATLLVLALTLLSACGEQETESRNGADGSAGAPTDYRTLLRDLEQKGLRVEPVGRVNVQFLQDQAYLARVEGEELRVFEFENADLAAAAADRVSPDGYAYTTSNGGGSVSWVAPPHFFRSGRTIVLYLGQQKPILRALSELLGREFAGAATHR
jgi:hypothetical protein